MITLIMSTVHVLFQFMFCSLLSFCLLIHISNYFIQKTKREVKNKNMEYQRALLWENIFFSTKQSFWMKTKKHLCAEVFLVEKKTFRCVGTNLVCDEAQVLVRTRQFRHYSENKCLFNSFELIRDSL